MSRTQETVPVLECPICLGDLKSPIYQCPNGHIVCPACLKKIKQCAVCRSRLPKKPIRSLAAEMLVTLERERGEPAAKKAKGPNYCRMLGLAEISGCTEITKSQLIAHLEAHNITGVSGASADISQELTNLTDPQSCPPVYFDFLGEIFFLKCDIGSCSPSDPKLVISWRCVTLANSKTEYSARIILNNPGKKSKLQFSSPIEKLDDIANPNKPQLSMPLEELQGFCTGTTENKLEWTIRVSIVLTPNSGILVPGAPKVKASAFVKKEAVKPSTS